MPHDVMTRRDDDLLGGRAEHEPSTLVLDVRLLVPGRDDSTIARQADRSGYPRRATLSFPAALLKPGDNTIALARGVGTAAGNGLGWDTLILELDEPTTPEPALLDTAILSISGPTHARSCWIRVTNTGTGDANDVRLAGFRVVKGQSAAQTVTPLIIGNDPNISRFRSSPA